MNGKKTGGGADSEKREWGKEAAIVIGNKSKHCVVTSDLAADAVERISVDER